MADTYLTFEEPDMSSPKNSHLNRFHNDPVLHLSGYAVFHGDDRQAMGEPLPTGTLPPQHKSTAHLPPAQNFGDSYEIRTGAPVGPHRGALATGSLCYPQPGEKLTGGTAFPYTTGTYVAESGLPPTNYKSWTSEYGDEYRSPEERAANLETLKVTHGTANALRETQFQHQGYPRQSQTFSRSSLTAKGQKAPDYESRVVSY